MLNKIAEYLWSTFETYSIKDKLKNLRDGILHTERNISKGTKAVEQYVCSLGPVVWALPPIRLAVHLKTNTIPQQKIVVQSSMSFSQADYA